MVKYINIGVSSQGKTIEEGIRNIRDAIRLYLKDDPKEKSKLDGITPPFMARVFL